MITIAIVAILLAGLGATFGLSWLNRESDYRFALRSARAQLASLRTAAYTSLPPQQLRVGADGWVQLGHHPLVPGSVSAGSVPVLQSDPARGRAQLKAAPGTLVTVNYRFYLSDDGEAHTVPAQGDPTVVLTNTPAIELQGVWVAAGDKLTPVPRSDCKLEASSGRLTLPPALAGRVVQVDYLGERVRNQVEGTFLDAELAPAEAGPCKLLTLQSAYGAYSRGNLALSMVKAP